MKKKTAKADVRFKSNKDMLLFFLKGSLPFFVLSACFGALVSLFDLLSPKLISFTVDSVIGDKATEELPALVRRLIDMAGGIGNLKAHLIIVAGCAVLIGLMGALSRYFFRTFDVRGAERLVQRMRNTLFEHIMYLPYTWHSENRTGDIIQRCTSDVQTIKRFLAEQMIMLVRITIMIVMAVTFMSGINGVITLVSALFIPVIVGYSLFFHKRISSTFEKVDVEEGKLSNIAQENLTGVRVVRAFGRENYERERFSKQNEYYTSLWVKLMRLMSQFFSIGDIISGLQVLTVITLGAVFSVRGNLTAGEYIALIAYNAMLTWPVRALGRVITQMSKAGVSVERLRYIMNSEPEKDRPGAQEPPIDRDIVFDHVSFAYENGGDEVLHDVSFTAPAGKTLGILGSTGSGKSTLIYLLERMYELPEGSGHITIGGVDIADIKAEHLRRNIGVVLQEPFLFSRSLSENIGIAADHPSMENIRYAAQKASIDDAITSFTSGYDTFVGERGVTLSGGQKQRTAIAQMLIRKPEVMVFDDSLSAVDAETDQKIRHAIMEIGDSERPTMILVAHRITTLMNADHIIVMDKGRIREEGTHEELLKKGGLYRKIYDLQTAGAEIS